MTNLATVIDEARRQAFVGRSSGTRSLRRVSPGRGIRPAYFVHGPAASARQHCSISSGCRRGPPARTSDLHRRSGMSTAPRMAFWPRSSGWSRRPRRRRSAPGRWCTSASAPIDSWVRSEFLPSLDAGMVVVLAGREPPSAPWRTDPGGGRWRRFSRSVPSAPPRAPSCWSGRRAEALDAARRAGSRSPVDARAPRRRCRRRPRTCPRTSPMLPTSSGHSSRR